MSPVKPERADNPVTPLDRALWLIDKLDGDASDGREGHCLCPAHDDEKPSLDVSLTSFTKTGQPKFICRAKCEQGAVVAALKARGAWPIPRDPPPRSDTVHIKQHRSPEQRREYAREIFRLVQDYDHRLVKAEPYFRNRGIKEVPKEAWITAPTKIKDDYRLLSEDPGIVFEVKDREGKFLGIHVIWLNDMLTNKRAAEPHRQSYGPIKGGFVQLGKLDKARPLVVAEGIETALAVLQITGLPCALVGPGTNFMEAIDLPDHSEITIAADSGEPGQDAAKKLAQRYVGARSIRIATPVKPKGGKDGFDWNDALLMPGADLTKMKEAILNAPAFEQEDEEDQDRQQQEGTQVDILLDLAADAALFHDDAYPYADIVVDGHRETWPLNAKARGFRDWLLHRYYRQEGSAPTGDALRRAIETLGARARFDGSVRRVHLRVGSKDGKIYLDLCDAEWRAVEIDAHGWRVVREPPVRFTRALGMLPLLVPVKGGSVADLRPFVNVQPDNRREQPDPAVDTDFVLLVAWLVATYRDQGPYPGLAIMGDAGAAKTTLVRVLCKLVDPRKVSERRPPREERDLHIAAGKAHIVSFGNVSVIPDWLSDAMCSLATGGGWATRSLYTDDEEVLFEAIRPIALNGVEFRTNPDLADRLIYLRLPPVRDKDRRVEQEFWDAFEKKRPMILGALLDVVAYGLRKLPNTPVKPYPRMADFAHWLTACEGALWEPGTFAEAYDHNRERADLDVIESETVATAVLRLMKNQDEWSGTATSLLDRLEGIVGDKEARRKHWPGSAAVLGMRLRLIASRLRKLGVQIDYGRGTSSRRIKLTYKKPVDDDSAPDVGKVQTGKARKRPFEYRFGGREP
jgi:hypothetical protein